MKTIAISYQNQTVSSRRELNPENCLLLTGEKSIFDKLQDHYNCLFIETLNENANEDISKQLKEMITAREDLYIINTLALSYNIHDKTSLEFYTEFQFNLCEQLLLTKNNFHIWNIGSINSPELGFAHALCLSLVKETTRLTCKSLAVDNFSTLAITQLIGSVLTQDGTNFIFKNNQLLKQNFKNIEIDLHHSRSAIKPRGNYVILGGNGGIGRFVTKYLVDNYQSNVFILGRKSLNQKIKTELKSLGAKAYAQVDVTNQSSLDEAFSYLTDTYGKIDGVFHLAGNIDDSRLANTTRTSAKKIVLPKILGSIHLKQINNIHNFDFVCCFSSLTSLIGNAGQCFYGAANGFMDSFCENNNARPNNATTWFAINWGLWDTAGMKVGPLNKGLTPMDPIIACRQMDAIISQGLARTSVYAGNLALATPPLNRATSSDTIISEKQSNSMVRKALEQWLADLVYKFCGIKNVAVDKSLIEMGVDSVALINILSSIENKLQQQSPDLQLGKALFFDYSSIDEFASYLMKQIFEPKNGFWERLFPSSQEELPTDTASHLGPIEKKTASAKFTTSKFVPSQKEDYTADDIAIVGIAGEFPGANNIEELWKVLSTESCTIQTIPKDRWNWQDFYTSDPNDSSKSYGRHGGFLQHAKTFDSHFFNINLPEAEKMDPQERRFLQTAYHSLEDAGYFANVTKDVGVYVASMFGHYQALDSSPEVINSSFSSIANRVSYCLDFTGPSMALDSMCSGALSALHQAVTSLKNFECKIALSGAVNIMSHPGKYRVLSQGKFLSPSGRCQSFGADADGYVPGEGSIAVVLKRATEALQNGDRIYGIVKASALNSGGKSSGYTVPKAKSQSDVIKLALTKSGVTPNQVSYIEAHGTGTNLGDPIEISALKEVFAKNRNTPLHIGSIKSNLGHLESAAGLAGLAKILLQFQHRTIVPSLFSHIENPHLMLKDSPLKIAKNPIPWISDTPLVAGLSSFGAGGSNAHVILASPHTVTTPSGIASPKPNNASHYLVPVSAKTEKALSRKIEDLGKYIQTHNELSIESISYTMACAREHFKYRSCLLVQNKNQLIQVITAGKTAQEFNCATSKLNLLQKKYLAGVTVDFSVLYPQKALCSLPLYPFETTKVWSPLITDHTTPQQTMPAKEKALSLTTSWEKLPKPKTSSIKEISTIMLTTEKNINMKSLKIDILEHFCLAQDKDWSLFFLSNLPTQNSKSLRVCINLRYTNFNKQELWTNHCLQIARALDKLAATKNIQISIIYLAKTSKLASKHELMESSMAGVFQTLSLENTNIKTASIELSEGCEINQDLIDGIPINNDDFLPNEFKYNQGGLYKNILSQVEPINNIRFKQNGIYIISGGLGTIGYEISKSIADNYNATVVILGTTKKSAAIATTKYNQLCKNRRIDYIDTDLKSQKAVNSAVAQIIARYGQINGVIHSAGILKDNLIKNKTTSDFIKVIDVKVQGAIHLNQATSHCNLDLFVVFSSLSSIIGNVGQADYVTANKYLNYFMANGMQQSTGCFYLSLVWPLWLNSSPSPNSPMEKYRPLAQFLQQELGIDPIALESGGSLFLELVNGSPRAVTNIIPLPGNHTKIKQLFLPNQLTSNRSTTALKSSFHQAKESTTHQTPLTSNNYQNSTTIDLVANITKLAPSEIDSTVSFGDLGLNSVELQQLAADISLKTSVSLPAVALFKFNTIDKLNAYLKGHPLESKQKDTAQVQLKESSVTSVASTNDLAQAERYAIIGMDGVMPGSEDLPAYWELLKNNKSAIKPVDRWPQKDHFSGTIPGFDEFDPHFFDMSPREAMLLDPQHRLFLQTSYNTFLDAGYNPRSLSNVAVFAGVQFSDYQNLMQKSGTLSHPYAATGNAHAMIANRVSYYWDFKGPSQTIDTACSSAFVAILRAMSALKNNECEIALAGAVSLLLDPQISDAAASMGVISENHKCATFDASADGYVRSEGVGCVLIKRYADALRDGDSIHAVIEAGSENHGGKSNSLTAPNPLAQESLLLKTYSPELAQRVSYIETHGTGTKLGDPIEIEALKMALKKLRKGKIGQAISLGAVKSNIGHLEPAAGMASLFKVILAMKQNLLPANINFANQNPLVKLGGSPFNIPVTNQPWYSDQPLVAGISCFGFGGSNTHLVLSQDKQACHTATEISKPELLVFSARNLKSLESYRRSMIRFLKEENSSPISLADLAFTLGCGREHFEFRFSILASSIENLLKKLAIVQIDVLQASLRSDRFGTQNKQTNPADDLLQTKIAFDEGSDVNFSDLHSNRKHRRIHIPSYHFNKKRYWFGETLNEK